MLFIWMFVSFTYQIYTYGKHIDWKWYHGRLKDYRVAHPPHDKLMIAALLSKAAQSFSW